MTENVTSANILSNPEDRKKLLGVLRECSGSLARIEGERTFIKEAVTDICEQLQLPKKLVNKMVKVYHKQNYAEEIAAHDTFETLYESVVK